MLYIPDELGLIIRFDIHESVNKKNAKNVIPPIKTTHPAKFSNFQFMYEHKLKFGHGNEDYYHF